MRKDFLALMLAAVAASNSAHATILHFNLDALGSDPNRPELDLGTPWNVSFDLDTAALMGTLATGTCGSAAAGTQVSGVYNLARVTGGFSNSTFSINGVDTGATMTGFGFQFYEDFHNCAFYGDINLAFDSGDQLFTSDQLAKTYGKTYPTTDYLVPDFLADALIDHYDGRELNTNGLRGPSAAGLSGSIFATVAKVPEPSALALFCVSLLGGAFAAKRRVAVRKYRINAS